MAMDAGGGGRMGPGRGPPQGPRQLDPRLVAVLNKLKTAKDKEEHNQIIQELQGDPQLMANFIVSRIVCSLLESFRVFQSFSQFRYVN